MKRKLTEVRTGHILTITDHLGKVGMWDSFNFQCDLLAKSMESDGPTVLFPTLSISVGKLLKLSVPCFPIYKMRKE